MKRILLVNAAGLACFVGYSALSTIWVPYGGTSSQVFVLELPLVLLLTNLFYFPRRDPSRGDLAGILLALLPWVALYVLADSAYGFMHRCPRFSDLENIPALLEVSLPLAAGFGALLAAVVTGVAVAVSRWVKSPSHLVIGLSSRAVIAVLLLLLVTSSAFSTLVNERLGPLEWSPERGLRQGGRIVSAIFFTQRRSETLERMRTAAVYRECPTRWPGSITAPRNIHVIVLESFTDPRLYENLSFDREPIHDRIRPWLGTDGMFDLVRAPVYGSGTAQTEFELLTGVPARARLSSIEFTVLEGHPVSSMVDELRRRGYLTLATIGTGPSFYNSKLAYRSLGFESVQFLGDRDEFREDAGDKYIFDGELLAYNLEAVARLVGQGDGPVFNYVLGMHGHYPFERNAGRRPDVVRAFLDGAPHDLMTRLANQFYYRTGAVADFIEAVRSGDPDAIILVVSDHLPPILGSGIEYSTGDRINIGLMLDGSEPVPLKRRHVFELPYLIWELLAGSAAPVPKNADLDACYDRLIAEGMGLAGPGQGPRTFQDPVESVPNEEPQGGRTTRDTGQALEPEL